MSVRPPKFSWLLLAGWLISTVTLVAQSSYNVTGTIVDASGARVRGVAVQLVAPGLAPRSTISASSGVFEFPSVPIGTYQLVIPAFLGFAAQTLTLQVKGSVPPLMIQVAVEGLSQTVGVKEESQLSLDQDANRDATVISGASLQRLPVFDQNFITALTPLLDPALGATMGPVIIVDGLEMKGASVSQSAIEEVRVNNDPYSAESNRPGKGRIEIMTKPGSSHFHGTLTFTLRDASLNARSYFAPFRPPEQRRIYEGYLTGPVLKIGHTTFVISGSRKEENTAVAVHAFAPQGIVSEIIHAPNRETESSFRVTHDLSEQSRLSLRYNYQYSTGQNVGVGGIVLPEAGYNTTAREDDLILNHRLILSPSLLNQLTIAFEKDEDNDRSVTQAASIIVKDSFIGGCAQADLHRTENTMKINDVVTSIHKAHYLRFGINIPQISRRAYDDHTDRDGIFAFADLARYDAAIPYVFKLQQGSGRAIYWINECGAFFQDQFQISPRLQISLGLRYDWQTILHDTNNFAPRVSAAWRFNKGKTLLRVGGGIFYDRTGGDKPSTIFLHNGIVLRTYQINDPAYPTPLSAGKNFDSLPTSIVRLAPNVRMPYSNVYSVGLEHQLTHEATLTMSYRGSIGVSLFRSRDANAPYGPDETIIPSPAFGFIQQIESEGRQAANAMEIGFRGTGGRWFAGQVQYTWGRIDNNSSGITWFPADQYEPSAEWGRADQDQRHRFNLLGNFNPGHWLTAGIGVTLATGIPYTETDGSDRFRTGLGNARPAGVGRNTLNAGGIADLDLRWQHDIHLSKQPSEQGRILTLAIDGFNALNHTNFASYIGSTGSPLFMQPSKALPGRQLQLNALFKF